MRSVLPSLVVLAACVSVPSFERPTAELDAVQVTGIGLTGGSLNLLLDVYNPNSYDIRTTRIEAGIDLEETHFGEVALDKDIVLPSRRHTVVELPVSFSWSGVGAGARGLLGRGSVRYSLDARVRVQTPVGEHTVGFRDAGVVPLSKMLP